MRPSKAILCRDMRMTEEERRAQRVENVKAWLDVIEETARELELEVLSRPSETASEAGVDPDPRLRRCEHRSVWMRGRLCLACDNTGLRPATEAERREGLTVDPYLLDPPREAFTVPRDDSEAARRARDAEHLDAIIASLKRDTRLRAGAEIREDASDVGVRTIERLEHGLGRTGRKILGLLETMPPELRRRVLAREERALALVASAVTGRLPFPAGSRGPV